MKIIHWDEAFHPSFGYQINSLAKYQAMLGHDVTIISSNHIETFPVFKSFSCDEHDLQKLDDEYSNKYNVKIIRLPWRKSLIAKNRIIHRQGFLKLLKKSDADIIMVHTNDTLSSIKITKHARYINKPLIFDNHMLDMASKNPFRKLFRLYFRLFITPRIIKNKWIVIRTQDDDYIIKHFRIPRNQAPFISFGSDLTIFYPNELEKENFRKKHNIFANQPVFLYAGKLTKEKGGLLLAEAFKNTFSKGPVTLVVIGNSYGEYGSQVENVFKQSKNNILRFSTQKFENLSKFYQSSDFAVFPKQCSLSFYDVQASGLPTILEDNNINRDRLQNNNGFLFSPNSLIDFRTAIDKCIDLYSSIFYKKISNNCVTFIRNNYDYKIIAEQYTRLMEKECKRQKQ